MFAVIVLKLLFESNEMLQEALGTDEDERPAGDGEPMGSLLIYPGCKVIIFFLK